MENTFHFCIGTLASALYAIHGGFSKVADVVNDYTGEAIKDRLTTGEVVSGATGVALGFAAYGLSKLVNNCYNGLKNSRNNPNDPNTPWLFQRLK